MHELEACPGSIAEPISRNKAIRGCAGGVAWGAEHLPGPRGALDSSPVLQKTNGIPRSDSTGKN